nr:hypothetical protein [Porphyromonas gulae]
MARDFFRFGARSKKFTRRNEKLLVRVFRKIRATICSFMVRKSRTKDMRRKRMSTTLVLIFQSDFECTISDWSAAIFRFILCLCPKFAPCRFTREKTIPLPY